MAHLSFVENIEDCFYRQMMVCQVLVKGIQCHWNSFERSVWKI